MTSGPEPLNTGTPSTGGGAARSLLRQGLAAAAGAGVLLLVASARGLLGVVLHLVVGVLLLSAGVGFVLAPLLRRRAGRALPKDRDLARNRSFLVGCAVSLAGAAFTGFALWELVVRVVDGAAGTG